MSDTNELRSLYRQILQAWNDRKSNELAECFSSDGVMIGFDGSLAEGNAAIRDHLAPIFANHPTAAFVTIIRSMRRFGSGGILVADVGMVPPGETEINPAANARQTMVAGERSGRWQVELFQNTPAALHWDEEGRKALSAELNSAFAERGLFPV